MILKRLLNLPKTDAREVTSSSFGSKRPQDSYVIGESAFSKQIVVDPTPVLRINGIYGLLSANVSQFTGGGSIGIIYSG